MKIFFFCFWEKKLYHIDTWMIWKKNQWNIITWERRFLESSNFGRYYWCRLYTRKKSLQRFRIKICKWVPWFVCSKRYIIPGGWFKQLSKYSSWKIWAWPYLFSFSTSISIKSSLKEDQNKTVSLTDIDISCYLLAI